MQQKVLGVFRKLELDFVTLPLAIDELGIHASRHHAKQPLRLDAGRRRIPATLLAMV